MTQDTWQKLEDIFAKYPMLRAENVSKDAIDSASEKIGLSFPEDYRQFLARYGAAIVGSYPIFGLREIEAMGDVGSVVDVKRFLHNVRPDLEEWLFISNDLAGNAIGFQADGSVWLADHEFGEVVPQAIGFEEFLRVKCLKL